MNPPPPQFDCQRHHVDHVKLKQKWKFRVITKCSYTLRTLTLTRSFSHCCTKNNQVTNQPIWVRLFFVGGRISLCGSEAGGNWIRHGVVREQRRGPVADGTCAVSDGWGCSAGTRALGGGSQYASMRRRPVAA